MEHDLATIHAPAVAAVAAHYGPGSEQVAAFDPIHGTMWAVAAAEAGVAAPARTKPGHFDDDRSEVRGHALRSRGLLGPRTLRALAATPEGAADITANPFLDEGLWCALYARTGYWPGRYSLIAGAVHLSPRQRAAVVAKERAGFVLRRLARLLDQDELDIVARRARAETPASARPELDLPFGVTHVRGRDDAAASEELRGPRTAVTADSVVGDVLHPLSPNVDLAGAWLTAQLGDDPAAFARVVAVVEGVEGTFGQLVDAVTR